MTDEQLNFLLLNLHNLSKYLAEQKFPLVTQYEILRNFQLMAERVGLFIWDDQTDKGSQLSELDVGDQTDVGSQLSELDEEDQTDKGSQLSGMGMIRLIKALNSPAR
ncbi:hypothetical protein HAX54_050752 [Datura stramonium]|uniref:Uncharacterized protein n=1 Tax=Datura stramonium TaxID=4076 RepID=A0ABS8SXP3_DATST|nr:hypothetical protein [Datura stramonium]